MEPPEAAVFVEFAPPPKIEPPPAGAPNGPVDGD